MLELLHGEAETAITEPTPETAAPIIEQDKTWRISYEVHNRAKTLLQQGDYQQAAAAWKGVATDSPAYTISVEVNCSVEIMLDTYQKMQAVEMPVFLLPANAQGRACFRLCVGIFASEERARNLITEIIKIRPDTHPFPLLMR